MPPAAPRATRRRRAPAAPTRVRRAAALRATYVYVLRLDEGRYYVGCTSNPDERIASHRRGEGSSWTSRHRVLGVESVEPGGYGDEAVRTIELMRRHGVERVRGGPWVREELPRAPWEERNFDEVMRRATRNLCFVCGSARHFASRHAAARRRHARAAAARR